MPVIRAYADSLTDRLSPTKNLNLMIVRNTKQAKGDVIW